MLQLLCHYSGTVPTAFGHMSALSFLYVESNALSGSDILPFLSTSLEDVDISDNLFSGEFPFNASGWSFINFYARDNHISGTIPTDLAFFHRIVRLDLSNNVIAGTLPFQLYQVNTTCDACFILFCI